MFAPYYLIALLAVSQSDASVQSTVDVADPPSVASSPAVPSASGKIIMYRQSAIVGLGLGCPIRYKGQEIVELGRGKYAEWDVPAGSYILTNKTSSVEINVFPGQTKYVRCQIKSGFLTGRADLQIVDQESFTEHQADFERKDVVIPRLAS